LNRYTPGLGGKLSSFSVTTSGNTRTRFTTTQAGRDRGGLIGEMGLSQWGAALFVVALAAPGSTPPKVTRIRIHKSAHTMELESRDGAVASYPVSLGPGGTGFKRREGDRVTPVGHYKVVSRGPSKWFKIFMRLDYPNAEDWARFQRLRAAGELPRGATIGGDIGIHGGTPEGLNYMPETPLRLRDWTLGCIGVEDAEISEISRRVPDGTPVDIDDD
jgi:murein L,D-transpeptidase YafK